MGVPRVLGPLELKRGDFAKLMYWIEFKPPEGTFAGCRRLNETKKRHSRMM